MKLPSTPPEPKPEDAMVEAKDKLEKLKFVNMPEPILCLYHWLCLENDGLETWQAERRFVQQEQPRR